jgi:hypothetical protein
MQFLQSFLQNLLLVHTQLLHDGGDHVIVKLPVMEVSSFSFL